VPTEIRTKRLPSTSQELCHYATPLNTPFSFNEIVEWSWMVGTWRYRGILLVRLRKSGQPLLGRDSNPIRRKYKTIGLPLYQLSWLQINETGWELETAYRISMSKSLVWSRRRPEANIYIYHTETSYQDKWTELWKVGLWYWMFRIYCRSYLSESMPKESPKVLEGEVPTFKKKAMGTQCNYHTQL
jgi:hypothetical protein